MYDFTHHRPASVDAAVAALTSSGDAKILAGGMTLIPTMKQRLANPADVVDLGAIAGLRGIREEGGNIVIGAMTPHAAVAADATVKAKIPALARLADGIGDPQVRNRGTIGGSIANNDPAADYPAGLVGLGATVHTTKRQIPADDFFTGMFETALAEDEIVTAVAFPIPEKAAYAKFANPASRYAIVGVMVSKGPAGLRVAVTGAAPCVYRLAEAEQALGGSFSADAVAGVKVGADGLNSDIHASAEYRANLVGVMLKRAVAAAG
ncbi:MAG: FAD binding domain-containing protein [Kiloniellaceae bacterium]